jgi:hypothetical protein
MSIWLADNGIVMQDGKVFGNESYKEIKNAHTVLWTFLTLPNGKKENCNEDRLLQV